MTSEEPKSKLTKTVCFPLLTRTHTNHNQPQCVMAGQLTYMLLTTELALELKANLETAAETNTRAIFDSSF